MKTSELANKIAVSRVHAWRLARAGVVPGTKKTKGGHYYFVEGPSLTRWINYMIGGAYRQKAMKRAYAIYYGNDRLKQKRQDRHQMNEFRKAFNAAKRVNFKPDDPAYFDEFHQDIVSLIIIFKDLIAQKGVELKRQMVKLTLPHLKILRDLIEEWMKNADENSN